MFKSSPISATAARTANLALAGGRALPAARKCADWLTYIGFAAGLVAMALFACYPPARRATSVPVMTALRYE